MSYLSNHQLVDTDDYDEAASFADRRWALDKRRSELISQNYRLIYNEAKLQKLKLAYIEHPCRTKTYGEGKRFNSFDLWFHVDGQIAHEVNGQLMVSSREQVVLHAPGVAFAMEVKPFRGLLLSLDGAYVQGALSKRYDTSKSGTQLPAALPSSPALATLRSLAKWTADQANNPQSLLITNARVAASLERAILEGVMEAFELLGVFQDEKNLDERNVRMAEEWIDANLSRPIGTEEVAAAMDVTVQALQQTFHRRRGVNMLEAINIRRLEKAHALLERAGPDQTVTSIATHLGFFELGRFAVRYRKRFGEKPSETLGRRAKKY